jgi:hypothetical protein
MKMRNNEAVNVTDDDDIEVFEEFILQSRWNLIGFVVEIWELDEKL